MVMLSDLLRYQVTDSSEASAALADLTVDLAAGDYPPVTALILRGPDRTSRRLDWTELRDLDRKRRRITVADVSAARPVGEEDLRRAVLLKRDVLDALVLDLTNKQASRANDLWLEEDSGALCLRSADVSPWAVIRRLARGWLGHDQDGRALIDWKHVEFLRGDPAAAREGRDYHRRIGRLLPAEIARLLDALPYLHAAELLTLIDDPAAADALEVMLPDRQRQVFEELDEEQAARLLGLMAPDSAVDLLGRLGPNHARHHLERLPADRADRLIELLAYPGDTAGGIMTNDVVVAPGRLTAGEARQALAEDLKRPDFVYYVYVVDTAESRRLQGVLTLRDLVVAEDDQRLEEIMRPNILTIHPFEPADEAARRVGEHNLAALPVIDDDGRLLGAVTADAVINQIAPPGWREKAPRIFS